MMYPQVLEAQINTLNENLKNLNKGLYESSKTSSKLQRWLIGWTIIMALVVLSQAFLIGIQIFG